MRLQDFMYDLNEVEVIENNYVEVFALQGNETKEQAKQVESIEFDKENNKVYIVYGI